MKILYKDTEMDKTFPSIDEQYTPAMVADNIFRTKLTGYKFSRVPNENAQSGWVWEGSLTQTRYGFEYPYNMTAEQARNARDRIAHPYRFATINSVHPVVAPKVTYQNARIYSMIGNCEYHDGTRFRTNGIQPLKITVTNASRQFNDLLFLSPVDGDEWVYEVMFGDPSADDYNENTEKIAAFFRGLRSASPPGNVCPIWKYDPETDTWGKYSNTGGKYPGAGQMGDRYYFFICYGDLDIWRGMYSSYLTGSVLLPEVEATI